MFILYLITTVLVFITSIFLSFHVIKSPNNVWKGIGFVLFDFIISVLWLPLLFGLSIFTAVKSIKSNFFKKDLEK